MNNYSIVIDEIYLGSAIEWLDNNIESSDRNWCGKTGKWFINKYPFIRKGIVSQGYLVDFIPDSDILITEFILRFT